MSFAGLCIAASIAFGSRDEPKTNRDYVQPEVGYTHDAVPFDSALSRTELERWMTASQISQVQSTLILAMYEAFVVERYNPLADGLVPNYLTKSAAASTALASHGMTSDEFRALSRIADQSARALIDASALLELEFINSLETIEPAMTPAQVSCLQVLRGAASRRKSHAVPSMNRWVNFELRESWIDQPLTMQSESDRATIAGTISEYEIELTVLVDQWSKAQLEAGRKIQRYLYESARGAVDASRDDPARMWEKPAAVTRRLRALHLRINNELLAVVPANLAVEARSRVAARMYPELYPHARYEKVSDAFMKATANAAILPNEIAQINAVRQLFDERYAAMATKLEHACADWDDEVASGVGSARSQDLAGALSGSLAERERLCEQFEQTLAELSAVMVVAPELPEFSESPK